MKTLTVKIVTSNFERAIEHVEAASKQIPVDPSTPISLTILWEVRQMKVSQVHREQLVCHFSKFLANNSGPYVSTVDVVPSHHCVLPQPKTENDTIDVTYV